MRNSIVRCIFLLGLLLPACATVSNVSKPSDWIRIGSTTKEEVIRQYGEPDFVMDSPEGEMATYRPRLERQLSQPVRVPVAQPGPLGTMTTREQPIEPGLGVKGRGAGTQERPDKEFRIQYDAKGVVRALIE
jgi:hypothetical protein